VAVSIVLVVVQSRLVLPATAAVGTVLSRVIPVEAVAVQLLVLSVTVTEYVPAALAVAVLPLGDTAFALHAYVAPVLGVAVSVVVDARQLSVAVPAVSPAVGGLLTVTLTVFVAEVPQPLVTVTV